MIIENNKPIKIIGYPESSMTDGYLNFFSLESKNTIEIISPENFLKLQNKSEYQYSVGFSLDMNLRKMVCDKIDSLNLDCVTYIHDTCVVFDSSRIGRGVSIGPFSTVLYHSNIQESLFDRNLLFNITPCRTWEKIVLFMLVLKLQEKLLLVIIVLLDLNLV
jgi:hypothetical protein